MNFAKSASTTQKVFVLAILFFFVVPIATAFCCCKSGDHHQEESTRHDHGEHHHQESRENSQNNEHGQDGCECGFENIAADGTIPTTHFSQPISSAGQWLDKIFAQNQYFSNQQFKSDSFYLNGASPPGARFLSTPLFLQLKTLRI